MKDLKVIFVTFLVVLFLNWGLSSLLNRPFKWWITIGLFAGFLVVYYFISRKEQK
ncbi:hypothetical protein [Enterococcus sp.]|uniref:hypothetical protein n=1 Tax=Enterococcus sp. TaxID=35783 RepID=UPI0028ADDC2A|nr:hypothetical protein [Enterococcus sp.]